MATLPMFGIENTGGGSVPTAYRSKGRHVKTLRYRATSRPEGVNAIAVLKRLSPSRSTIDPATIHLRARFAILPTARVSGPGIDWGFSSNPSGHDMKGC